MTWNAPKVLQKWGWWILPGSRRLGHLVLILGRRADHHTIFHIFPYLFYHWFFIGDCSKFCVKKNEIHCSGNVLGVLSLGCSLFHGILSVTLTDLMQHRGLWSHFLSRVGLAPPLALSLVWASRPLFLLLLRGHCDPLSLSLSCTCGPCAPPSYVGSAPTSVLCTSGVVPLSAGRSFAHDTPACPKSLLCLSVWLEFRYQCV